MGNSLQVKFRHNRKVSKQSNAARYVTKLGYTTIYSLYICKKRNRSKQCDR